MSASRPRSARSARSLVTAASFRVHDRRWWSTPRGFDSCWQRILVLATNAMVLCSLSSGCRRLETRNQEPRTKNKEQRTRDCVPGNETRFKRHQGSGGRSDWHPSQESWYDFRRPRFTAPRKKWLRYRARQTARTLSKALSGILAGKLRK